MPIPPPKPLSSGFFVLIRQPKTTKDGAMAVSVVYSLNPLSGVGAGKRVS